MFDIKAVRQDRRYLDACGRMESLDPLVGCESLQALRLIRVIHRRSAPLDKNVQTRVYPGQNL